MVDYSWITQEAFDAKLSEIINTDLQKIYDKAAFLFIIPGIYEILSEHYNNEVLGELESDRNENEEIN